MIVTNSSDWSPGVDDYTARVALAELIASGIPDEDIDGHPSARP